jgi:acyl-coenzyme A thioesterase PaaI-like protein
MSESIFLSGDERPAGDRASTRNDGRMTAAIRPTEHARGPWDPRALHGGAPAALLASTFERMQPGGELRIARLGFEFLRPIPLAPLTLSTWIVRPGRRVQELAGELTATDPGSGAEQLVCRASALRVQAVPADVAASAPPPVDSGARTDADTHAQEALPPPEAGKPVRFSLDGSTEASFAATAMEMRWLDDPQALGPGRVWMRLRHPLLPGEPLTPLARLAATADFGNGVSAALAFERFLFINADLTIHLQRPPRGEWIGLDARTLLHDGGTGLAESVLHDVHGPVGRAFQTLVVQPR